MAYNIHDKKPMILKQYRSFHYTIDNGIDIRAKNLSLLRFMFLPFKRNTLIKPLGSTSSFDLQQTHLNFLGFPPIRCTQF